MTDLPIWAQTNEAQRLLARIAKNPPAVSRYDDGLSAFNGRRYEGGDVTLLRELFTPFYDILILWVSQARTETRAGYPQPKQHGERHDAVARYEREFGVDAVIARLLGEAQ